MRRKRSCAYDQGQQNKIINVRAVITGLDGVGKSGQNSCYQIRRYRSSPVLFTIPRLFVESTDGKKVSSRLSAAALTVRFLTRRFIGEYDENLEMTYRHHMTLEGKYVTLDIMDTAGKNTEKKLETLTSFGALFFILYSITDRFSFMEAKRLGRHIKNARNNQCTLILVGTKTDLGHHRKISDNEGVQLAKELGSEFCQISIAEGYVETNSLLYDSLRLHLNNKNIERSETKTQEHENSDKDKSGPLSWMKEGFKGIYTRRKSIA